MKSYNGTIAESWLPTFENVTREFITETLYKILFSEEIPNFRFEFIYEKMGKKYVLLVQYKTKAIVMTKMIWIRK